MVIQTENKLLVLYLDKNLYPLSSEIKKKVNWKYFKLIKI